MGASSGIDGNRASPRGERLDLFALAGPDPGLADRLGHQIFRQLGITDDEGDAVYDRGELLFEEPLELRFHRVAIRHG